MKRYQVHVHRFPQLVQCRWTFFHKDYNDSATPPWLHSGVEEKASEFSPNPEFILYKARESSFQFPNTHSHWDPKARELVPPQSPPPAASE